MEPILTKKGSPPRFVSTTSGSLMRIMRAKGTLIKWNPAVKTKHDRDSLMAALLNDKLDVIATDHAPHTIEEKQSKYFKSPSGGPMVQHALVAMLELVHQKRNHH